MQAVLYIRTTVHLSGCKSQTAERERLLNVWTALAFQCRVLVQDNSYEPVYRVHKKRLVSGNRATNWVKISM